MNIPFLILLELLQLAILTEFLFPEEIANTPLEDLIDFIMLKAKNRFSDPKATAKLLQRAARDSYRLDKASYYHLISTVGTSFNCIKTFNNEIESIDKSIMYAIKALDNHEFECLTSIKGICPVFAAGIISEIGDISKFDNQASQVILPGKTLILLKQGINI